MSLISIYLLLQLSLKLASIRFRSSLETCGTSSYTNTSSGILSLLIWILSRSMHLNIELLIMHSWGISSINDPSMVSFYIFLSFMINRLLCLSAIMAFVADTLITQVSLNISFRWVNNGLPQNMIIIIMLKNVSNFSNILIFSTSYPSLSMPCDPLLSGVLISLVSLFLLHIAIISSLSLSLST